MPTLRDADDRNRLASLRNGWTNYIAACLRNAGFREQGDLEERIHDVVVKLLVSPGGMSSEDLPAPSEPNHDPKLINRFRAMLQSRLGDLAVAIFDARLEGHETKSLVGLPELGRPGRWVVKRVVQQIKTAARDYAQALGDTDFLWQVERLLDAEAATVARRTATTQQRRVAVGA
ncbi:MAG: hypothetical protein ACLP9L_37765 [Thermoguttaceae bacterium]